MGRRGGPGASGRTVPSSRLPGGFTGAGLAHHRTARFRSVHGCPRLRCHPAVRARHRVRGVPELSHGAGEHPPRCHGRGHRQAVDLQGRCARPGAHRAARPGNRPPPGAGGGGCRPDERGHLQRAAEVDRGAAAVHRLDAVRPLGGGPRSHHQVPVPPGEPVRPLLAGGGGAPGAPRRCGSAVGRALRSCGAGAHRAGPALCHPGRCARCPRGVRAHPAGPAGSGRSRDGRPGVGGARHLRGEGALRCRGRGGEGGVPALGGDRRRQGAAVPALPGEAARG